MTTLLQWQLPYNIKHHEPDTPDPPLNMRMWTDFMVLTFLNMLE